MNNEDRTTMISAMCQVVAADNGTTPTYHAGLGFAFSSLQSEANFCYDFVCRAVPSCCWLQPGNSATDKSGCKNCTIDCSGAGKG